MKNPLRPLRSAGPLLALVAAANAGAALVPTEWSHRQDVVVAAPGLIQVELTDATFDIARPDLADLRVLDPQGREVAMFPRSSPLWMSPAAVKPVTFDYRIEEGSAVVVLQTSDDARPAAKLEAIELKTPHPHFLRSASVEISDDRLAWKTVETGLPLFRQWGAEKLSVPLGDRVARWIRIRVSGPALPITEATLVSNPASRGAGLPMETRIVRREEFAGETVFTVALAGRNMTVTSLEFDTPDPFFLRRVSVATRDLRELVSAETTLGAGTIYRVTLDPANPRSQLVMPLLFDVHARELLVRVHNGDSPPLTVTGLRFRREPGGVSFHAPTAGRYTLLSGNPPAQAPRYDFATLPAGVRPEQMVTVTAGPIEPMPGHQPRTEPSLPEVPLAGAPLNPAGWTRRQPVLLDAPGVQELELSPAALAGACDDLADLRLLRAGHQIPYLVERTPQARVLTLTPEPAADPRRPGLSIWRLELPQAGLPLRRLALTTDTTLFQRNFRLYEKITAGDGRRYEHTLASGTWHRTPEPDSPRTLVLDLTARPRTATLWLETDNGDNPPIVLAGAKAEHPVVRLVFKAAETDGFALVYGNPQAAAPRYDLSLVARHLLAATRSPARTGPEEFAAGGLGSKFLGQLQGGVAFWSALALVVIVLLTVMARLLPKPPATETKNPRR